MPTSSRSRFHNLAAFTLLELLIVIAIIGALAALLFPALAASREKARVTTCLSNEKEIGFAILQYAQDYDETLPERLNGTTGGSAIGDWSYIWERAITVYVKSPGVFVCPSNPRKALPIEQWHEEGRSRFNVSYAANRGALSNPEDGPLGAISTGPFVDAPHTVPLSKVASPATVIGVLESTSCYCDFLLDRDDLFAQNPTNTGDARGALFAGHHGLSNYLFLDGHVKSMKPLATLSAGDGGTGSVNLWTIDNRNQTSGTAASPIRNRLSGYKTLSYAENLYR